MQVKIYSYEDILCWGMVFFLEMQLFQMIGERHEYVSHPTPQYNPNIKYYILELLLKKYDYFKSNTTIP